MVDTWSITRSTTLRSSLTLLVSKTGVSGITPSTWFIFFYLRILLGLRSFTILSLFVYQLYLFVTIIYEIYFTRLFLYHQCSSGFTTLLRRRYLWPHSRKIRIFSVHPLSTRVSWNFSGDRLLNVRSPLHLSLVLLRPFLSIIPVLFSGPVLFLNDLHYSSVFSQSLFLHYIKLNVSMERYHGFYLSYLRFPLRLCD